MKARRVKGLDQRETLVENAARIITTRLGELRGLGRPIDRLLDGLRRETRLVTLEVTNRSSVPWIGNRVGADAIVIGARLRA